MSLALEVREIQLRIVDMRGAVSSGAIFLHTIGELGVRPEPLVERLNDPDARFVPIRRDGGVDLVHLAWVAYVAALGRSPEVAAREAIGAQHASVELELASGERLNGELVYLRPAGSARVSDLLNGAGERFLMLVTPEETLFVNREAIVRARTG